MFKRILIAIDGSKTSQHAFEAALDLAKDNGAELRVLYVMAEPQVFCGVTTYDPSIVRDAFAQEGAWLTAEAAETMRKRAIPGDTQVIDGEARRDVADCIIQAASDYHADLLVLGTHGRSGVRRLMLGSVAERCLRRAALPVLLIPGRQDAQENN